MHSIKPMGLGQSSLYFGLPAMLFIAVFYLLRPYLMSLGFSPILALMISLSFLLMTLLVSTILAVSLEGNIQHLIRRLRLGHFSPRYFLWAVAAVIFTAVAAQAMTPLTELVVDAGMLPLPDSIPSYIDPRNEINEQSYRLMLGSNGTDYLLMVLLILLVLNVFAEEIWWRGYVLPRQELYFGSKTWLIHAFFWAAFHAAQYWTLLILLPGCLAISYIAQRTQSTWPAMIAHFVVNGVGLIPYFLILS